MKIFRFALFSLCLTLMAKYTSAQCEPFFGKLVINEVLPGNDNSGADEFGENDDWVEIYNASDEAINLEGFFLSDNDGNETKFVFPDFELASNEVVTIWCDDQPEQGPFHAAFRLSGSGEEVGLYDPDTLTLDYVRFGAVPDDISVGRFPNGEGPFSILIPTFDGLNTNSVQPGLVINEYQSSNESTAQDQWGGFEDWIELYNAGNSPINLEGYFLSDKIGSPTEFVFPDTTLMPDEYLIIWCDMGLMEPGLHTFFRLGGDGDDILLSNPDTLTIDYVSFGVITTDESEGRYANGTGPISCFITPTHGANNGDPLSSEEIIGNKTFKVYPNPSSGSVVIESEEFQRGLLQVFSSVGTMVYQTTLNQDQQRIDLEALPPGFYVMKFNNRIAKIVIE
ncbi:lamin tail domain-containing protein [Cryomorphaceae bacterium 1068]|nr:lamin tail domain-containing protein [Cryomorphaceae bacterium 1068]